ALVYIKKRYQGRKGLFVFLKDVNVYDPKLKKYNPKVIEKQAREERKRQEALGLKLQPKTNPVQSSQTKQSKTKPASKKEEAKPGQPYIPKDYFKRKN
ncbi:MAG: hypothetical protein NZ108_06645, partial [Bacteroidia bacterium]|nr:hypothetical protein [Bacteroidia bacterium]